PPYREFESLPLRQDLSSNPMAPILGVGWFPGVLTPLLTPTALGRLPGGGPHPVQRLGGVDLQGLDVEGQFEPQGSLDSVSATEAMTLPWKFDQGMRDHGC